MPDGAGVADGARGGKAWFSKRVYIGFRVYKVEGLTLGKVMEMVALGVLGSFA